MSTDIRGHTVPAGSDAFDPQGADVAASLSMNDIIIAANATDAASKVAAIAPTTTRPCLVWQTDTKTLKVYDGSVSPQVNPGAWVDVLRNATFSATATTTGAVLPGCTVTVTVPIGRVLEVDFQAPYANPATGSGVSVWLNLGGTVGAGARISTSTGVGILTPVHLSDSIAGTGSAVTVSANAIAHSGTATIAYDTSTSAPVIFRYRII